ncbi:MAG TPA: hypothetical protein PKW69_10525, partial [Niabella sp.]|nr:hypothetical protein [Niabella sp.]
MKNIKKYMLFVLMITLVLFSITGCKKFLDRKPLQATLQDLNQGGLEGLVYGLYGGLRNPDVGGAAWGHIPW